MLGLLRPGATIGLSVSDNPKRKLAHTLEMVRVPDFREPFWVGVNTLTPNRLLRRAVAAGAIPELAGYDVIRSEPPFAGGRLDFALSGSAGQCLVECKNVTMATCGIPGYGYGILYDYGLFHQLIVNGWQEEQADDWRRHGSPWVIDRVEHLYEVHFYGRSEPYRDRQGALRYRWVDTDSVMRTRSSRPHSTMWLSSRMWSRPRSENTSTPSSSNWST